MHLFSHARHDVPASIVVFFVALPLCLGIALASGAPLFSGLIAGVIGGVVVGLLSGSPLGVSGPAAGLAVIVLSSIQTLGSFQAFLVAVVLAGLLQMALGVARAGVLGYFFPSSVIKGMLAGIGVIIVMKQLPHAVGYDADFEGDLRFTQADGENTLSALTNMWNFVDGSAMFIALSTLVVLIAWDKHLKPRHKVFQVLPGALAAVLCGVLFQFLTERFAPALALSPEHLVAVPVAASVGGFFGLFTSPDWSHLMNPQVYVIAATLAVVASLETLLCVEATDKLDPHKRVTPTNRELVAQGTGNVVSGLLGGLPITQVIVRSSANIQSGAHGRLSTILHGLLLAVCVATLPHLLNMIPLAVLAGVLLVVGYKLAQPALFKAVYRQGMAQFLPFIVTVLGVVLTDLLSGIAAGMVVAILFLLRRSYLNSHFLHMEQRDTAAHEHIVTLRLAEEVTFLNKGAILKEFSRIPDRSHVVIDRSACIGIDHDVREIIEDFRNTAQDRGITVELIDRPPPQHRPAFLPDPPRAAA
ncbi:MAG: SulP family inorganic anion transporter [Gammaproteobacteria bacterium]